MTTHDRHARSVVFGSTVVRGRDHVVGRVRRASHAILVLACCAACATGGQTTPSPEPTPAPTTGAAAEARALDWTVKTREHVDLWLHGFAMLEEDTGAVPLFRRGYRDELTVFKNRANVLTQLDANVDRLRGELRAQPALENAQFVPFYFSSLPEMRTTIEHYVSVNGNPNAASSQMEAALFQMLSSYFTTPEARRWLALFSSGLWDEEDKVYHGYWVQQQRERGNVIDSVTAMWVHTVYPKIQRFLNNTQQRRADILLSLPLGGEGRTVGATGPIRATVAVNFPSRPSDVPEAMYVVAHEVVGTTAAIAVRDNVTPAQQRAGVASQLQSPATVRGGLMLLEKFLPELADGYARYYIRDAGRAPGANPRAQLVALFPIPDAVRTEIAQQLDAAQGGI